MLRITFGVLAGFFAWIIVWFGTETVLSAVWPEFGAHQAAFQAAIEKGASFSPNTTILLIHIVLALIVSAIAGSLAAFVASDRKWAPLMLGVVLLAFGLLKAGMSWTLVPVWYHVLFAAVLLPMATLGGKLNRNA